jgi:hypothetical protein
MERFDVELDTPITCEYPPRMIIADGFNGKFVILRTNHPDEGIDTLQAEARRIRAARHQNSIREFDRNSRGAL